MTGQAPGTSFHDSGPGAPSTASFGPQPPPPPPPREANPQWVSARSAPNQLDPRFAQPGGRGGRTSTSGWSQSEPLHEQAAGHTWENEEDDDRSSFHSTSASSPSRHSPHRSQPTPMQGPAGAAWGNANRPSSARSVGAGDFPDRISQGSGSSVSGQGHAALPHGLLQPGMNGVQSSAWAGSAFAPHSIDPQFGLTLPDQLAPMNDPVISPGFMHRSAPARPLQPQLAFNPAAPLQSYVEQETCDRAPRPQALAPTAGLGPAAATSANMPSEADAIFLNDVFAGQEEDNKPVGIYAAPAGNATAATTLWPALDALPAPGGLHPALVHPFEVSLLSKPPCRPFCQPVVISISCIISVTTAMGTGLKTQNRRSWLHKSFSAWNIVWQQAHKASPCKLYLEPHAQCSHILLDYRSCPTPPCIHGSWCYSS